MDDSEPLGSRPRVMSIMRADKLLAVVLGLETLDVVSAAIAVSLSLFVLSLVVLWGTVTFRRWGLWIALVGAALAAVSWGAHLKVALGRGWPLAPLFAAALAMDLLVLVALWVRRERFG